MAVKDCVAPFGIVGEVGETVMDLSATPVPVRLTDCGEAAPVSVNVSLPPDAPAEVGRNMTETVQLESPESDIGLNGQVLDWIWKGLLVEIAVMVTCVVGVFVNVTIFGALVAPTPKSPKAKVEGTMVTGSVPVPVKEADCDPFGALSVTVRLPAREPVAVG